MPTALRHLLPMSLPRTRRVPCSTALRGHVFRLEACDRPLRRAKGGLGLSKKTDAAKNRDTSANGHGPAGCHVDTFCGDHSSRKMHRRMLAGRFPVTTLCRRILKDMPTQSRGHGTRRFSRNHLVIVPPRLTVVPHPYYPGHLRRHESRLHNHCSLDRGPQTVGQFDILASTGRRASAPPVG